MKKSLRSYYLAGMVMIMAIGCAKPKDLQYLDIGNFQIRKAGISESLIGADVKYYNPNSFNLKLKKANLDLYINDKYVGHTDLDTLLQIPALDTFNIPITMRLNLGDLLKNAAQLLLNPEVKLRIQGSAKVGKSGIYKNVPVNYEGKERIDVLLKDSSFRSIIDNF